MIRPSLLRQEHAVTKRDPLVSSPPDAQRPERAEERVTHERECSRRDFVRRCIPAIIGVAAAPPALYAAEEGVTAWRDRRKTRVPHVVFSRRGNTLAIETPNGVHYICYNNHESERGDERFRELMKQDPDPLPTDADAVSWEMLACRWTGDPVVAFNSAAANNMNEPSFRAMSERNIPAVLMTPYLRGRAISNMRTTLECAEAGAWLASTYLLRRRQRNMAVEDTTVHRRRALSAFSVGIAGTWALSPLATALASLFAAKGRCAANGLLQEINESSEALHPEVEWHFPDHYLMALIMTQKLACLRERRPDIRNLVTIVGSNHFHFARIARMSEIDRLREIVRHRQLLTDAVDPESVSRIALLRRSDRSGPSRSWHLEEVLTDEKLRQLMGYAQGDSYSIADMPDLRAVIGEDRRRRR